MDLRILENWWHVREEKAEHIVVDPERKNAVLLATNVRASHNHLFRAVNKIKAHYSPAADLPAAE
jgi:hypothetical protein